MAFDQNILGLVGYQLAFAILDDLNRQSPGTGERVLENMRALVAQSAKDNPLGNSPAMLEVLATHKY